MFTFLDVVAIIICVCVCVCVCKVHPCASIKLVIVSKKLFHCCTSIKKIFEYSYLCSFFNFPFLIYQYIQCSKFSYRVEWIIVLIVYWFLLVLLYCIFQATKDGPSQGLLLSQIYNQSVANASRFQADAIIFRQVTGERWLKPVVSVLLFTGFSWAWSH